MSIELNYIVSDSQKETIPIFHPLLLLLDNFRCSYSFFTCCYFIWSKKYKYENAFKDFLNSDVHQKVESKYWLFNITKAIYLIPTANIVLDNKITEVDYHRNGNKIRKPSVGSVTQLWTRSLGECVRNKLQLMKWALKYYFLEIWYIQETENSLLQ